MLPGSLAELVDRQLVAPDWAAAIDAIAAREAWDAALGGVAAARAVEGDSGARVLPELPLVFRACERPLADVRVLIVGQDPYPTPGHAIGLAFATNRDVTPLPRSLKNIFRELDDDTAQASTPAGAAPQATEASFAETFWAVHSAAPAAPPRTGDLSGWAASGVLLLNRVLTVRAGEAGSHRGIGWETLTEILIRALVARGGPLVAVLWGNDARGLRPLLGQTPVIESAHPSPLSASRGFFGSQPFSRVNDALVQQGAAPVDWHAGLDTR